MTEAELIAYINQNLPDFNRNRALAMRKILTAMVGSFVSAEDIIEILDDLELDQDNLVKIIKLGTVPVSVTENNLKTYLLNTINNLNDDGTDYKLVGPKEIVWFDVIRPSAANVNGTKRLMFRPLGVNKGEYGENGNITLVSTGQLQLISETLLQLGDVAEGPNTHVEDLGNISDGDYLNEINNTVFPYFVITDPIVNWYFEFTQDGDRVVLAFQGDLGTYGLGQGQMVEDDLYIILDEREPPVSGGENGLSAYEVAVANGFVGTEAEWLESLVGPEGPQGPPGEQGAVGPEGPEGPPGSDATVNSTTVNAAGAVMEADYDANTILASNDDNTPLPLTVAPSTFIGRKATGGISALSISEAKILLGITGIRPRATIIATGVSGTYDIDFSLGIEWRITCVGATTFTFSNYTAALGESTGIYFTGAVPVWPGTVNVVPGSEDPDAAKRNYAVLNVFDSTASSEIVDMMNKLMTA